MIPTALLALTVLSILDKSVFLAQEFPRTDYIFEFFE